MNDRQHTAQLVFSAAQMKQTHRIMPMLKSAAEVPVCSVTHAAVMWNSSVCSQVSHQRVRGMRWKTSCHSCLQDSSTSYNRLFMFGCDLAEFNQRADEWECSLIPCSRTLNNQKEEICSLSRSGQVAVSLYSHRKERCDWVFRKKLLRWWNQNNAALLLWNKAGVSQLTCFVTLHTAYLHWLIYAFW